MAKVRKPRRFNARSLATCEGCGYTFNTAQCPCCGNKNPNGVKKPPTPFEDRHQAALFDWISKVHVKYPHLLKLYHVPNGGARNALEGKRLKAQGVRAGQLDLNLDVGRGGWFGLRIELKATREELGKAPPVDPKQRKIIAELREDGYYACVCEGWDAARSVLVWYCNLAPTARDRFAQDYRREDAVA